MKTPLRTLLLLTSLCFGLAPFSALAQRLQEPWRRWQESPVTVPLSFFAANIYAVSNSGLTITLADATLPAVGLGCDVATNSTAASAGLKPYKEYVCIGTNATNAALFSLVEQFVIKTDSLGHVTNITRIDGANSAIQRVVYTADWKGTNSVDGDLKLSETDEDGVQTIYTYDSLERVASVTKKGATLAGFPTQLDIVMTLTYDAYGRKLSQVTSASGLSVTNAMAFDLSGRLVSLTSSNVFTTTLQYAADTGHTVTETLPGGATRVTSKYRDRRVRSVTGTAVVAAYHSYSNTLNAVMYNPGERIRQTDTIHYGAANSARWSFTGLDNAGRESMRAMPGCWGTNVVAEMTFYERSAYPGLVSATSATSYASGTGSLIDNGGTPSSTLFDYDAYERPAIQGTQLNTNETPGGANQFLDGSLHRFTRTETFFTTNSSGHWFEVSTNRTYLTDNDATSTILSTTKERLSGFASATVKSETTTTDVNSNSTVVTVYVDRTNKKLTEVADTAQSTLNSTNIALNGLLQSESTPSVAAPTQYRYDGLGRQTQVISPLGATSTLTYDPLTSQVTATADWAGSTTTLEYYSTSHTNAGRLKTLTAANGKKTYYEYNARGQPTRTWGDVPYPEERIYNDYGDMTELRTFRGGSGWSSSSWPASAGTADSTTWIYQETSGLLTNKTDAAGKAVSFTYDVFNRPYVRTWARGVSATNIYDPTGDLLRIDYSDGTPSVAYTNMSYAHYSRASLPRIVSDASGEHALRYDHASRLVSDKCTNGTFNGIIVSNHFNGVYGRDYLRVEGISSALQHDFAYDTYGRLSSAGSGVYSASYGYLANSDRLQTTTCKSNTTAVLTTTRTWDYGERLRSILNTVGTGSTESVISSHSYLYDSIHRRTQATLEDSSLWKYGYDDRDEVTSGKRFWSDWTPVAGQQFEYAYDNIGNRASTKAGGDSVGASLRQASYTNNTLNQITGRDVPGAVDVLGAATATASVTVSSSAVYEKGEYYHREVSVSNGSGPAYPSITVTATEGANSTNETGNLLVPPATQTFAYDADGNLTNDSVWAYYWDAENRLKEMTALSTVPDAAKRKLVFRYDHQNRRISKTVSNWVSGAWQLSTDNRFVYDLSADGQAGGWNLLTELSVTNNALIRSYVWGQDLGGTLEEAGGIGGLLLLTEHIGAPAYHFVAYDGNGNVTGLLKVDDQSLSAQYQYSPFGETLRSTGSLARNNPFRFSTKFTDEESSLIAYPQRLFSPAIGRWVNRDPVEEGDGNNLYAFVVNRPTDMIDPNGQSRISWWATLGALIGSHLGVDPANVPDSNTGTESALQIEQEIAERIRGDRPNPPAGRAPRPPRNIRPTTTTIVRNRNFGGRIWRGVGMVSGFLAIAQAAEAAPAFANQLVDFSYRVMEGEDATLDAVTAAIEFQNIGGNYFATAFLLGVLLDIADN